MFDEEVLAAINTINEYAKSMIDAENEESYESEYYKDVLDIREMNAWTLNNIADLIFNHWRDYAEEKASEKSMAESVRKFLRNRKNDLSKKF